MKKTNKGNDFLNFFLMKQELEKKIENKKKNNEKPFTQQEFVKFKYDIFLEIRDLVQKMQVWFSEGQNKEDASYLLSAIKDKKDEELNQLFEECKNTYINDV